uniref:FH2 domain-containing protein n=1 Tax=Hucho hucho TaxID=62062 RepID=A0A4W5NGC5_9TELE
MFAQKSFHELVAFLGLKPKTGETEVATGHFFMLWFEFCTDFKTRWRRENKDISKERLKEAQLSVKKITADKKVVTRNINPNSLVRTTQLKLKIDILTVIHTYIHTCIHIYTYIYIYTYI